MNNIIETEGIRLPKNDYQVPTEIRDWVVDEIVREIVRKMNEVTEECHVLIRTSASVFLADISANWHQHNPSLPNGYVRVRGVELAKVWRVLQDAGYYVYRKEHTAYDTATNQYLKVVKFHWDKKPYWREHGKKGVKFEDFID